MLVMTLLIALVIMSTVKVHVHQSTLIVNLIEVPDVRPQPCGASW